MSFEEDPKLLRRATEEGWKSQEPPASQRAEISVAQVAGPTLAQANPHSLPQKTEIVKRETSLIPILRHFYSHIQSNLPIQQHPIPSQPPVPPPPHTRAKTCRHFKWRTLLCIHPSTAMDSQVNDPFKGLRDKGPMSSDSLTLDMSS